MIENIGQFLGVIFIALPVMVFLTTLATSLCGLVTEHLTF